MNRRYVVLGLSVVLALSLAVPAIGGPSNPVATSAASVAKAIKKAKKAKTAADAAQSTANTALNTANAANTRATQAQTAAAAAQTTANTANTRATAANTNANTRLQDTFLVEGGDSANDGTDAKLATADCATLGSEHRVTGGGHSLGGTDNADEAVVLSTQYGEGWGVIGQEINGTTPGNWSIAARAVCASSPNTALP